MIRLVQDCVTGNFDVVSFEDIWVRRWTMQSELRYLGVEAASVGSDIPLIFTGIADAQQLAHWLQHGNPPRVGGYKLKIGTWNDTQDERPVSLGAVQTFLRPLLST